MKHEDIKLAVKRAAERMLSGDNGRTACMDVAILVNHALGRDNEFNIIAVKMVLSDPERTYTGREAIRYSPGGGN